MANKTDTFTVYINGAPQASGYTFDFGMQVLTFSSPPAKDSTIQVKRTTAWNNIGRSTVRWWYGYADGSSTQFPVQI